MSQQSLIEEAIERHIPVGFTYKSSHSEEITKRTVVPWVIGERNGKIAMVGAEFDENFNLVGIKRFNMDRASKVKLLHEKVDFPETLRPHGVVEHQLWHKVFKEWNHDDLPTERRVA